MYAKYYIYRVTVNVIVVIFISQLWQYSLYFQHVPENLPDANDGFTAPLYPAPVTTLVLTLIPSPSHTDEINSIQGRTFCPSPWASFTLASATQKMGSPWWMVVSPGGVWKDVTAAQDTFTVYIINVTFHCLGKAHTHSLWLQYKGSCCQSQRVGKILPDHQSPHLMCCYLTSSLWCHGLTNWWKNSQKSFSARKTKELPPPKGSHLPRSVGPGQRRLQDYEEQSFYSTTMGRTRVGSDHPCNQWKPRNPGRKQQLVRKQKLQVSSSSVLPATLPSRSIHWKYWKVLVSTIYLQPLDSQRHRYIPWSLPSPCYQLPCPLPQVMVDRLSDQNSLLSSLERTLMDATSTSVKINSGIPTNSATRLRTKL